MKTEKFQWNASIFAIFHAVYENPKLLLSFFILCYFIFSSNEYPNGLWFVDIDQGIH